MTNPIVPKLLINYHVLDEMERVLYLVKIKPNWDERSRFFFEGCRDLIGQMHVSDRMALYDTIIKYRPRQCFEVGTWTGGGSTYFLASAFKALGTGKLITMEAHPVLHELASGFYRNYLPELHQFVDFVHGGDVEQFDRFIDPSYGVDCVFIDGAESAEQTFRQYEYFLPLLRPGAILMAHDWNTEKQALLRPHLERSDEWILEQYIGEPRSVGFALYVYNPKRDAKGGPASTDGGGGV